MKDEKRLFYVTNEEGIRQEAEIIAKYKLLNGQNYISYTFNEINDNDMIKIYTTGIEGEKGNYSYKEIVSSTEWDELKNLMKFLAKDSTTTLKDENKCDLEIVGEDIAVRKPKKLLVSSKFANTIKEKYSEEKAIKKEDIVIPVLPEIPVPVKEEVIEEKQINVPTFEELQARTKKTEEILQSAKPQVEPVVMPEPVAIPPVQTQVNKQDYKEKFKQEVEPLLLDVYAKQQKQIEELEEELSKTKFDLFEKQKETLSLKKENEELNEKGTKLESELVDAKKKMDGILNVIRGEEETI